MVGVYLVMFAGAWFYGGLRKVRPPALRFAVVMAGVYLITFAAAWLYGGLRKWGSPDPGMVSDQALAPLGALIYTGVAAGIWFVFMLVRLLIRRLR